MKTFFLTRDDREVGAGSFDSIKWLYETHLHEVDDGEFNYALLHGMNEDNPKMIQMWRDEPNYDSPADKVWYHDVKLKYRNR